MWSFKKSNPTETIIVLAVSIFIVLLTEFTSNTASAALLVPLFISIAESLGAPPLGLALIIGIGASCAFMLPVATPPNAIVFGTGYIKQSQMIKAGLWLNAFCSVIIAVLAYYFGYRIIANLAQTIIDESSALR